MGILWTNKKIRNYYYYYYKHWVNLKNTILREKQADKEE